MTLPLLTTALLVAAPRERLLFDRDWRFALNAADRAKSFDALPPGTTFGYLAKAGDGQGAAKLDFDDSKWRRLDLPHDWAVELPFDGRADGNHGSKALGPLFPETSVGWYRKSFEIPAGDRGRRISLDFDGVFRDSQVWVNGFYLGRHASGYTSFGYDVGAVLNYGGKNVVTVRVDATENEGWFYEGAGIYRHVWLTKTAPLHVARWGTFVTTEAKGQAAAVTARATVQNDADATARFEVTESVLDPEGRPVAEATSKGLEIGPGASVEVPSGLRVGDARLWSCETPTLYTLVTTIRQEGKEVDRYETPFGIRTLLWDANRGFFLNGERVQLKGVCDHQDHAGVGTAIPDALDAWRLRQLRKMGVNAVRTSHNAPDPALLDACDRLGILVMDENREYGANPQQLDGLRDLMRRDRNHPSVIIWSLGNEEWNSQWGEKGARITATMQAVARSMDPSRRMTQAINSNWGEGSSTVIDVMGFNYLSHGNMDEYHAKFPGKPSVGTEDASTVTARGVYVTDRAKGLLSAYDVNKLDWSLLAGESVPYYAARPYVAGQFQWTGFDYRGEPTPFGWPNTVSHFGILDLCGFPKDNFYYYRAWWKAGSSIHLFPHWNWRGKEGQPIDVWVHGQRGGGRALPERREPRSQADAPLRPSRVEGALRPRDARGEGLRRGQGDPHRRRRDDRRARRRAPCHRKADPQGRRRGPRRDHGRGERRPGPRRRHRGLGRDLRDHRPRPHPGRRQRRSGVARAGSGGRRRLAANPLQWPRPGDRRVHRRVWRDRGGRQIAGAGRTPSSASGPNPPSGGRRYRERRADPDPRLGRRDPRDRPRHLRLGPLRAGRRRGGGARGGGGRLPAFRLRRRLRQRARGRRGLDANRDRSRGSLDHREGLERPPRRSRVGLRGVVGATLASITSICTSSTGPFPTTTRPGWAPVRGIRTRDPTSTRTS